jgi:hypothetical protein
MQPRILAGAAIIGLLAGTAFTSGASGAAFNSLTHGLATITVGGESMSRT